MDIKSDEEEAGGRTQRKDRSIDKDRSSDKIERDPAMPMKKEITLNISPDKDQRDRDRKEYRKNKDKRKKEDGSINQNNIALDINNIPKPRKPTEESENDALKLPRIHNKHSSSLLPELNIKSSAIQRDNSNSAINKYNNLYSGSYNQNSNSSISNPGGIYKMLNKDK